MGYMVRCQLQPSGKIQRDLISFHWIQYFCDRFRIVSRSQSEKLKLSQEKTISLEKYVALQSGKLNRGFDNKDLDEDCISNADKTHFFDMDDGRTFGFTNGQEVGYADVTSGSVEMMRLFLMSGEVNEIIEPPLMIFKNQNRNYPMRNVPDNTEGFPYRTTNAKGLDGID